LLLECFVRVFICMLKVNVSFTLPINASIILDCALGPALSHGVEYVLAASSARLFLCFVYHYFYLFIYYARRQQT